MLVLNNKMKNKAINFVLIFIFLLPKPKMILYLHRLSARVAQLVERQPSKLNVASSNLVSRSKSLIIDKAFFYTFSFFPKTTKNKIGKERKIIINKFSLRT